MKRGIEWYITAVWGLGRVWIWKAVFLGGEWNWNGNSRLPIENSVRVFCWILLRLVLPPGGLFECSDSGGKMDGCCFTLLHLQVKQSRPIERIRAMEEEEEEVHMRGKGRN
ncbi:hypothetical protein AAC387_Pa05g3162 [Persea americana]